MAGKRDDDKLIFLLPEHVSEQLDRVFERLVEDKELRVRFAENPVEMLKELDVEVPADTDISLVNRVILHLMGNEKFIAWSHDYNIELEKRYGATIEVDEEVGEAMTKDVDAAIRGHLPAKLRDEYDRAGGIKAASIGFMGIAVFLFVAVVFNATALVNAMAFWNVGLSEDHMVGLGMSGGKALFGGVG